MIRILSKPLKYLFNAQNALFFYLNNLLSSHRPKAFLLENVKNLKRHNKCQTFKTISGALQNALDNHVSWKVIDGKG